MSTPGVKYGLTANINQQLFNTHLPETHKTSEITPCRVKHIILDEKDDFWKDFGEWNSIGIIFYNGITAPSSNDFDKNNFAKPFSLIIKITL